MSCFGALFYPANLEHQFIPNFNPLTSMTHPALKRKLDEVDNNFTKSFIFKSLSSYDPSKSQQNVLNLVDDHIKTNSHIFLQNPTKLINRSKRGFHKKGLSNKEKKKLGLFKLDKDLKFEDVVPLHALWSDYIVTVGTKDTDIVRADLHGCYLTVVQSMCPHLLRKCGVVVMETMNSFTMVTREDKVMCVPKKGSVFSYCVKDTVYTIYGNNFLLRPGERVLKKMNKFYKSTAL